MSLLINGLSRYECRVLCVERCKVGLRIQHEYPEVLDLFGRGWPSSARISGISRNGEEWFDIKNEILQQYDFDLCWENTVVSNYVSEKTKYYGPHKRYDYWYTGQNTEIIGYEQKIDNQYFLATYTDPANTNDSDTGDTKTAVNRQSGGDKTGSGGTPSNSRTGAVRSKNDQRKAAKKIPTGWFRPSSARANPVNA
jgi:hypothetical protein